MRMVDGVTAAVAKKGRVPINQSATSITGATVKGQSGRLEIRGSKGVVDRHSNEINSRNAYSNKKINNLKVSKEVEVVINDEVVDNESVFVGAKYLRENALEEEKLILINSLKTKEHTVAAVSSTLMNSSTDLMD